MSKQLKNNSSLINLVVIHQPDFLSYLGFFHRLLHADLYIVLDDIQYVNSSRSWTNRDKIKTQNGESWLTVNVEKSSRNTLINQIKLSSSVDWKKKNLNLLKQNYSKAKYFDEIFPYIQKLYTHHFEKLVDFNMASIFMILELFDISIDVKYSSNFKTIKTKSDRLADLLMMVNASHYLSGMGAKAYHDNKPFNDAKIEVIWQNFQHPVYSQMYGDFIKNLSTIDLFFNCGIEQSREILRRC